MSPDVMRGEETILLGAARLGVQGWDGIPGTHCKWAQVQDGALIRFDTSMTGKIFALFAGRSTLSGFIDSIQFNAAIFDRAVEVAVRRPEDSLRSLFHLRAGPLLNSPDPFASIARAVDVAQDHDACLVEAGTLLEAGQVD